MNRFDDSRPSLLRGAITNDTWQRRRIRSRTSRRTLTGTRFSVHHIECLGYMGTDLDKLFKAIEA